MPPKRPRKKRRTESDEEIEAAEHDTSSGLTPSTRHLPPDSSSIPTLSVIATRVFAVNFRKLLGANRHLVEKNLRHLPDAVIPKVFAMLSVSCPGLLHAKFIEKHFLRGPIVILTDQLPGVKEPTISMLAQLPSGSTIRHLELCGFDYPDVLFESALKNMSSLRVLNLRNCSNVGVKTMSAIANRCRQVTVLNLNYTAVTPASLVPVLLSCTHIEVLKLAGISNWTDATFAKFLGGIEHLPNLQLTELRTLKLRQTSLSDPSIRALVALCPGLQRLDIASTLVLHPLWLTVAPTPPPLQKLSLSSNCVSNSDILDLIPHFPQLRILHLGALGQRQHQSSRVDMGQSSALTFTNEALKRLTDILEKFAHLESVSLVANAKLCLTERRDGAMANFIARVGRKCKSLNLAGIPNLRSTELSGLIAETAEQGPPRLRHLTLNHTDVDDNAAPFISSCSLLETLEVAGTKFTSAGLFPIIDACRKLEVLDVTGCRGVRVVDRRRFFEAWEKEKNNN